MMELDWFERLSDHMDEVDFYNEIEPEDPDLEDTFLSDTTDLETILD